jgi:MFS family permease
LNPEGQSTAAGVAKAYSVLVIPFSLVGPLSGVFVDRWSRRAILAVTTLAKAAAAVALLALPDHGAGLYVPSLLIVSLNRFFLTTATASIPVLVSEQDLLIANSMSTVGGTVVTFVGIVAGTKLTGPLGAKSVVAASAVLWPVASVLATRIARPLLPAGVGRAPVGEALRRAGRDLRLGARRLLATPRAAGPIVTISLDQFLIGFVTVLSLVVFKERFHAGVGSYGNIVAAGGVGVLAGTLTVGWLEGRLTKPAIVTVAFGIAAVACLAVAPDIVGVTILVVSFVLGLSFAWKKIPVDTMAQEAVPDRYRGRVFAVYDITYSMSRVAAAGLAIVLIPHVSAAWLLLGTGLVYLLWTPVLPVWVRRPQPVDVRFVAGGRADEVPRAISIAGDETEVEVVRSATEDRGGRRWRVFVVRTPDDDVVRLAAPDDDPDARWRIEPAR